MVNLEVEINRSMLSKASRGTYNTARHVIEAYAAIVRHPTRLVTSMYGLISDFALAPYRLIKYDTVSHNQQMSFATAFSEGAAVGGAALGAFLLGNVIDHDTLRAVTGGLLGHEGTTYSVFFGTHLGISVFKNRDRLRESAACAARDTLVIMPVSFAFYMGGESFITGGMAEWVSNPEIAAATGGLIGGSIDSSFEKAAVQAAFERNTVEIAE